MKLRCEKVYPFSLRRRREGGREGGREGHQFTGHSSLSIGGKTQNSVVLMPPAVDSPQVPLVIIILRSHGHIHENVHGKCQGKIRGQRSPFSFSDENQKLTLSKRESANKHKLISFSNEHLNKFETNKKRLLEF